MNSYLFCRYAFLLKRKLDVKGGEIEYASVADVLDEGNEVSGGDDITIK